ncbi:MAG: hypothetical protein ACUVS2_08305 [Candidatus Flexifilum sp.]
MVLIDTLAPALIVLALLWVQRRLESWLSQHLFKVGWLITKDLRTTTLLYYLFFLPGVILHELTLWLTAGILNVRAERAIAWPEAQAAAELKLNFVRVSQRASALKLALIHTMPSIVGIILIYAIANGVLNISGFITLMQGGSITFDAALSRLLSTPDFFLWVYLIFVIGFTMWPDVKMLKGWRIIGLAALGVLVFLYVLGIGDTVLANGLAIPLAQGLNILSAVLTVLIAIQLTLTGVLGILEAAIERITGDSATFRNGKLEAIRRADRLKREAEERARLAKQRQQQIQKARADQAGPPSIYRLPLPVPDGPGKETVLVDDVLVTKDNRTLSAPAAQGRAGPAIITGTAVVQKANEPPPQASPHQRDEGASGQA